MQKLFASPAGLYFLPATAKLKAKNRGRWGLMCWGGGFFHFWGGFFSLLDSLIHFSLLNSLIHVTFLIKTNGTARHRKIKVWHPNRGRNSFFFLFWEKLPLDIHLNASNENLCHLFTTPGQCSDPSCWSFFDGVRRPRKIHIFLHHFILFASVSALSVKHTLYFLSSFPVQLLPSMTWRLADIYCHDYSAKYNDDLSCGL